MFFLLPKCHKIDINVSKIERWNLFVYNSSMDANIEVQYFYMQLNTKMLWTARYMYFKKQNLYKRCIRCAKRSR